MKTSLLFYNGSFFDKRLSANAGSLIINNSTISANSVEEFGGGLFNEGDTLVINNSTITDNRAGMSGAGISSYGDGTTLTTIANSIAAGNVISGTGAADDLALYAGTINSFSSGGYNLIGAMGPNINFAGPGDVTNVKDPEIGPLADNGGDTLPHALLPDSPAIDAGGDCDEPFDQRGAKRPQGVACDIGGYEFVFNEENWIFLPAIFHK